jgi:hypothetical protein
MNVASLTDILRFRVPSEVVDSTDRALREAGAQRAERFVLWPGRVTGTDFVVETAYVPVQTAHTLPDGLCVTVDGNELHKLNRWLYENDQTLAVQIHSHPTRAYHSDTDSTYPIVTQRGGLSIVVPNFARDGVAGTGVATYRLDDRGWRPVRGRKLRRLLALNDEERS